jgi:transposase
LIVARQEREINGQSAQQRLRLRAERAQPLVDDLESWLRPQRGRFSPKSETAIAIDYTLRRWP